MKNTLPFSRPQNGKIPPCHDMAWLIENLDTSIDAYAIDFETYYDDTHSVAGNSYHRYTHDPRFDAYLVSVVGPGIRFVGHPTNFDWSLIHNKIWVSHNRPFDEHVFYATWIPDRGVKWDAIPHAWVDSADLASWLQAPRNLKGAVKELFGADISKQVRADMKGRRWADLTPDEQTAVSEYALSDSELCLRIWEEHKDSWPRREVLASIWTGELPKRGVKVDTEKAERWVKWLRDELLDAEADIPWSGEVELTPKGRPRTKGGLPLLKAPSGSKHLAAHARSVGVPMPASTDVKSKEFQEWETEWAEKLPAVKSVQRWRKCNMALQKILGVLERVRADGRMEISLMYGGAPHTMRWAGARSRDDDDKTVNMQNLIKAPVETSKGLVDIRSLFIANDGYQFSVDDLSQIEPRCLSKIVGLDTTKMAEGMSPYELHARQTMGWAGGELKKEDPKLYALAKARVLACGYGVWWRRFIDMALLYIGPDLFREIFTADPGEDRRDRFEKYLQQPRNEQDYRNWERLDPETQNIWVNSWGTVQEYRDSSPEITGLWKKLDTAFRGDCRRPSESCFEVALPSGDSIKYFDPQRTDWAASKIMGGKKDRFYGGKLVENLIQRVARNVFTEGLLRIEAEGHWVLWAVHDESITEVELWVPAGEITNLLGQAPGWWHDLPVAAEGRLTPHYIK